MIKPKFVYLVFNAKFSTDFDGELIAAYLDINLALESIKDKRFHYVKEMELTYQQGDLRPCTN